MGVATSVLYRMISSREDLLRACLGEVAARIDFSPDPDDWRRNARNQADALWALLEAHPGLDRVLIGVPWAVEYFADTIGSALGNDQGVALGILEIPFGTRLKIMPRNTKKC